MAVISKDLGAVTAYAAAVNRGYTGTKEEFETLMASYATVAQQAAESAQSAEQSAQSASGSATDAQTAQGTAQQAAMDAQTAQASAQGYAQSAQQSAQSASQYAQSAESAKDTAVDAVDGFAAGAQQALESVNSAGINWKSLAQAHALDSEAWAVGQRDGENVGSSDPAYHNNAKYYAESAGSSAQTATEAAQTATAKAGEAQASASAAAESARTLTIDATLTQSGQAADAKATGDKNDVLKSALGYGFLNTTDYTGDANDLNPGVSRVTASATHIPVAQVGYVITFARTESTAKAQLFINAPVTTYTGRCHLYARYLVNKTWSNWVDFANDADLAGMPAQAWTQGTDYSADLNDAPAGIARVLGTATHNPAGEMGYVITIIRAASAKAQIFVTNNAMYFRTSASSTWSAWNSTLKASTNRSVGYTFGDSLMAQDGNVFAYNNPQYNVSEIGSMCVGWQTLLHNKFGVTITNYAVGGQGIAAQKPVIKSKTYTNVDFVVISVGVNDYSNNVALGQLPASRNATFTSGRFIDDLCDSIEYILNQNPQIKILLFTPCQRDTTWRNGGVADFSQSATDIYTPNGSGLYLKDYAQAIRDVGAMYSCVVCDMYANGGLNYLTLPTYTFEGVHPTNEGYEFTAPVLYEAFKKL